MGMKLGRIEVVHSVDRESFDAMQLSLSDLSAVLASAVPDRVTDHVGSLFFKGPGGLLHLIDDGANLFRLECAPVAAAGAYCHKLVVRVRPSEGYEEFFAAVAFDGKTDPISYCHGWPILTVGCGDSTVAGRGGVASVSPEGRPA